MALSDCAHCWDTPCTCGHEYKSWPTQKVADLSLVLQAELLRRENLNLLKENSDHEARTTAGTDDAG